MKAKTLIVGAGLSGLALGQKLSATREVAVFDKARGVGGRIATRRTEQARFDHGAQFYRLKEPLREWHARWASRSLVNHWFDAKGEQHFNAIGGMTSIAKDLAIDLRVVLDERVRSVKSEEGRWRVTFESSRSELVNEIIFSCPVPQSLEILKGSGISYDQKLDQVTYTKALVVLIENSPVPFAFQSPGYVEPQGTMFFSIADQTEKRVSSVNALTATLAPEPSEKFFDAPEAEVIQRAITALREASPEFQPGAAQLKKWRYCQVQKTFGELFNEVAPGLYLAGDGFGGASLNGAARSATALSKHLNGE